MWRSQTGRAPYASEVKDDSRQPSRCPCPSVGGIGVDREGAHLRADRRAHHGRDCARDGNRLPRGGLRLDAARHVDVVYCRSWRYSLPDASAAFWCQCGSAATALYVLHDWRFDHTIGGEPSDRAQGVK